VSDAHDDIEPGAEPGEALASEDRSLELKRPDPRLRPPDPAGTQPKWDPDELLPKETPRAASGRLWAPAGEDGAAEGDTETVPAGATAMAPAMAPAPAETSAGDGAAPDDAPTYSRYSPRFQFLLGALLAVGAAAVALLVLVLAGDTDNKTVVLRDTAQWSEWRPTATGVDAARQIADHVGHEYRLPSGRQLVLVDGGPMQLAGLPVTIAIQQPLSKGGDIDIVDDGVGVMYRLCGSDSDDVTEDCALPGKPSERRGILLRREALELALYSFRYLGVSAAVVLLPPTVDANAQATSSQATSASSALSSSSDDPPAPSTALLFQRDQADVQRALSRPLTATLSSKTPSIATVTRSPDAGVVQTLTKTKAYRFKFQEANQDAAWYMLMAPLMIR
jgi:hypothetical protein